MSNFVRMFKPQFAPMVANGTKLQTVRPRPKRLPKAGDTISLRCWTGLPYRSKQRVLRESDIEAVRDVEIYEDVIALDGKVLHHFEAEEFAMADGFNSPGEMTAWFRNAHGLPFTGIVIYWKELPQ